MRLSQNSNFTTFFFTLIFYKKALYPESVSEDEEGYLSINYVGLIPIIVEANKQQEKRIEALEAQLASFINS